MKKNKNKEKEEEQIKKGECLCSRKENEKT
jgi:hypothetical protein